MCIDQPIFDRERESPLRITDGVFVPAADVDPAFVREKKDGLLFLDALAPQFRISGIRHPKDNGNEYYRLDAAKRTAYSPANASLAECTAGAQIRFRTDAEKLTLRITLRAAIAGMHHFTDRGAYGIDLYTGTGTKRTYLGAMMQTFADSPVYNEQTVALPADRTYTKLYVLASAVEEPRTAEFRVGDRTYEAEVPLWKGFYGQWGWYGNSEGFMQRAKIGYLGTHRHQTDLGNVPYGFSYMYLLTFDIPEGATTVTLPRDKKVLVYAMTASNNPIDDVKLASRTFVRPDER